MPSWTKPCGRWDRETTISLASFLAIHLLALALLAATAYVAGRLASRRWIEVEGLERLAVSTALGLVLLAHLGCALGLLGLLARGPLIAGLAGVHLLGVPVWREILREVRGRWGRPLTVAVVSVVSAAPIFFLALYPPTAFDETMYHLPYARAFARTGSLPFLPDLRFPVFPQLAEVLHAELLLLLGDVATHLVAFLATGVTAALLIAWGRSAFGRSAGWPGWIAAAAFLGNPIVIHLAGSSYVDPLFTLLAAAAVHALARWHESASASWLTLAAVFAGSAAASKYLGLFFVGLVLAVSLWSAVRDRRPVPLIAASAVLLAVLAPWYGRILAYTGNPLFPFAPGIFGSSPWAFDPADLPAPVERFAAYARFPLDVLFHREAVGGQPPFSPVYLLGLPLLALGLVRSRLVRGLLVISLAYSFFLFVLPPDARYMTVVLPLASLALAGSLSLWHLPKRLAPVLAVLLFLPGWSYGVYRIERQGPLPVTVPERDSYLARKLPAYAALAHLNRLRGREYTAYGVYTENMVYHAEGTLLGDWNGPAKYRTVLSELGDAERFHRRLRELGAGYLVLVRERGVRLPRGPAWRRLFRRIYSDAGAEVYELSPFAGAPGAFPERHWR